LKEKDIPASDSVVANKPKVEIEDPEAFMRSVQVTYLSETEIRIKVGSQGSNIFGQKELGFKKLNSEIWKAFIGILRGPDHAYSVGKAHGAKRTRKTSYDVLQKRLSGISKIFVPFLNETYQANLSKTFRVYELMPEKKEEPGKYRFKFKVCDPNDAVRNIDSYNEFSEKQLIAEIEMLSSNLGKLSNRGDEDSEIKIDKINSKLYQACDVAGKKGWLGSNQLHGYLKPSQESVFPHFEPVYEKYDPDLND
jgi:hypothetical protein